MGRHPRRRDRGQSHAAGGDEARQPDWETPLNDRAAPASGTVSRMVRQPTLAPFPESCRQVGDSRPAAALSLERGLDHGPDPRAGIHRVCWNRRSRKALIFSHPPGVLSPPSGSEPRPPSRAARTQPRGSSSPPARAMNRKAEGVTEPTRYRARGTRPMAPACRRSWNIKDPKYPVRRQPFSTLSAIGL